MGKLTGTKHGDAASELLGFYSKKSDELAEAGQHFMAAVALAFAVETAVLAYLLVEFGDDNGGELEIPDSVNFSELIDAANEIDVLSAPIAGPSQASDDGHPPKHVAKEVIDKIRKFRNLIHPARALRESFDPQTFTAQQLKDFQGMYDSIIHSLLYYL